MLPKAARASIYHFGDVLSTTLMDCPPRDYGPSAVGTHKLNEEARTSATENLLDPGVRDVASEFAPALLGDAGHQFSQERCAWFVRLRLVAFRIARRARDATTIPKMKVVVIPDMIFSTGTFACTGFFSGTNAVKIAPNKHTPKADPARTTVAMKLDTLPFSNRGAQAITRLVFAGMKEPIPIP